MTDVHLYIHKSKCETSTAQIASKEERRTRLGFSKSVEILSPRHHWRRKRTTRQIMRKNLGGV